MKGVREMHRVLTISLVALFHEIQYKKSLQDHPQRA
jgi:hypothetical protein